MTHRRTGGLVAVVGMVLASVLLAGAAQGNTYSVRTDRDSGPGSLRAAVTSANAESGRDVVTFAPSARGAIDLKSRLPALRGSLEVRGPGPNLLTVRRSFARGTPSFRVFETAPGSNVTISGLTISNGFATRGGGIQTKGKLTVRNSTISGNRAGEGGGIESGDNIGSDLLVVDSVFLGNRAGAGGGIRHLFSSSGDDPELTIRDSTFLRNEAGYGAAVRNSGDLTAENTTFSENVAEGIGGGGIHNDYGGSMTILGSTFDSNVALSSGVADTVGGGGILNDSPGGRVSITNSTFFGNSAERLGGGVYNRRGPLSSVGNTFANNSASDAGGGLYNSAANNANFSVRASIVANNEAPQAPDAFGAFVSEGYNLVENPIDSSGFGPTDVRFVDPALDPDGPQENGGPTRTVALQPGSPAVDAVGAGCPPPAADQRGVSRPQDGDGDGAALCDIGSFELVPPQQ